MVHKLEKKLEAGCIHPRPGADPSKSMHHATSAEGGTQGGEPAQLLQPVEPRGQHTCCGSVPRGQQSDCGSEPRGKHTDCGSEPRGQHTDCGSVPRGKHTDWGSEPRGKQSDRGSGDRMEDDELVTRGAIGKSIAGGLRDEGKPHGPEPSEHAHEPLCTAGDEGDPRGPEPLTHAHEAPCAAGDASLCASKELLPITVPVALALARGTAVDTTTIPDPRHLHPRASKEESRESTGALSEHVCSGTTAPEEGAAGKSSANAIAPGCLHPPISQDTRVSSVSEPDTANHMIGCVAGREMALEPGKIPGKSTWESAAGMTGDTVQAAQQVEISGAAAIRLRYPELFATSR